MRKYCFFAVDIGNTCTKFAMWYVSGIQSFPELEKDLPIPLPSMEFSDATADFDELKCRLTSFPPDLPSHWLVSSVNERKTNVFTEVVEQLRPQDEIVVLAIDDIPMSVCYDDPHKLGVDRAVAAFAAIRQIGAGRPFLMVDVGTAMTIDYVDSEGVFRGGAILPGPRLMTTSLNKNTYKLPLLTSVDDSLTGQGIENVPTYPATETHDAINLGVIYSQVGAICSFYWKVRRTILENGGDVESFSILLAGGDSSLIQEMTLRCFKDLDFNLVSNLSVPTITIERHLIVNGLYELYSLRERRI